MIPSEAKEPRETYASDLDQILQILEILPLLPKSIVATTAFARLREVKLRGFELTDYTGAELMVRGSIRRGRSIDRRHWRAATSYPNW
jgi:hypothetical protein